MAHFAEIDPNTSKVIRVLVTEEMTDDEGQTYLSETLGFGGTWVKTSYNTRGGVHVLGGTPLRKNYAGIGYLYDKIRDAFYLPQPFKTWRLNEETCYWEAPIPMPEPEDGFYYAWNDAEQTWAKCSIALN